MHTFVRLAAGGRQAEAVFPLCVNRPLDLRQARWQMGMVDLSAYENLRNSAAMFELLSED